MIKFYMVLIILIFNICSPLKSNKITIDQDRFISLISLLQASFFYTRRENKRLI